MSSLYAFIRAHGSEREVRAAARALAYGRKATVVSIHRCVSARTNVNVVARRVGAP